MKTEKRELAQIVDFSTAEAISIVEKCLSLSVQNIEQDLAMYLTQLKALSNTANAEAIKNFVYIVQKGFFHVCEEADALKYYYLGYCNHQQEELIQKLSKHYLNGKIQQISRTKHFEAIIRYLYKEGCSRQSIIASQLNINKSNLSRNMDALVECDLVYKHVAPKCVFYELSAQGYAYCRENGLFDNQWNGEFFKSYRYEYEGEFNESFQVTGNRATSEVRSEFVFRYTPIGKSIKSGDDVQLFFAEKDPEGVYRDKAKYYLASAK